MKEIKVRIPINYEMFKQIPIPIGDKSLKYAEELSDLIYTKLMQEEAKIIAETISKIRKIKKDEVEE